MRICQLLHQFPPMITTTTHTHTSSRTLAQAHTHTPIQITNYYLTFDLVFLRTRSERPFPTKPQKITNVVIMEMTWVNVAFSPDNPKDKRGA